MEQEQIKQTIDKIDNCIGQLNLAKKSLKEVLRETMQFDFEKGNNIKSGDLILIGNTKYFYKEFIISSFGEIVMVVNPVKKDGTQSNAPRHVFVEQFKGKVSV